MLVVPIILAAFATLMPGSRAGATTAVPPEVPSEVLGSAWLSGHGVNVCYPVGTPCTGTTVFPAENPTGTTPYNWQCEELAARLWSTMNWYSGGWTQYASQLYGGLASSQVTYHANDGSYVPVPGDLIIHAANDGFAEGDGHVAVVDSVDPGTLTIHAVEENVSPAYETSPGRATYTDSAGHWTRQGASVRPIGFVHANADKYSSNPTAFTADSPPSNATPGMTYSYSFTATGTPAPSFSLGSGAPPFGLQLSSSGLLSGSPTTSGAFTFTVNATNGGGTVASPSITIVVAGSGSTTSRRPHRQRQDGPGRS